MNGGNGEKRKGQKGRKEGRKERRKEGRRKEGKGEGTNGMVCNVCVVLLCVRLT